MRSATEAIAKRGAWEEDHRLVEAIALFTKWLDRFGEVSYDHQSYFAGPIGRRAKALYYSHPTLGKIAVAPMIASEALFPSARRLFWKRQRFPIADAHYAMAFASLAHRVPGSSYYDRAVHFLKVLESSRCPGSRHHGWGYPFDWVTRTGVMTSQTPLITSTPYVYEAFSAVHRIDGKLGNRDQSLRRQRLAEHLLDVPGQHFELGHVVVDHEHRQLGDLIGLRPNPLKC